MNPDSTSSAPVRARMFSVIYISGLLLSFHYFFTTYINSAFLSQYASDHTISILYIAGSILCLCLFLYASNILREVGNFRAMMYFVCLEIATLIGLATIHNIYLLGILFIIHQAVNPFILFCLDIFLENYSRDEETGSIRGMYLTSINIPPVIATFITGLILTDHEFWKIYLIASLFLLPLLLIVFYNFRTFRDPEYKELRPSATLRNWISNENVYNIFIDNFLLQFFYAWMVIYIPIYLTRNMGFSIGETALMFSIMLIPFVLLQIPVGKIADKRLGEKEMLLLGLVIMGVSTIILSLLDSRQFIVWATLLFFTRIGASLVEITTESYFFKHVDKTNTDMVSLFRMTRPLSYVVTAIITTVLLVYMPYNQVFFTFGIITIVLGLRYTLPLRDTK